MGLVEKFLLTSRTEIHYGTGRVHLAYYEVRGEIKVKIARELGYDPKKLLKGQYEEIMREFRRRTGASV